MRSSQELYDIPIYTYLCYPNDLVISVQQCVRTVISILSTPRAHGTHNNTTDTDTQTRAERQQEYDKHHRDQPNRAQSASSALGLGRAARRAAQTARRPPGVGVISRLEDEADCGVAF